MLLLIGYFRLFFFFNDTATTEIYTYCHTLSLHDALPIFNPFQLRTMGLEPGDMVKVATRRGEIALNVRADRDVPEGMVFIPFCFNEAAANMLTNPQLDPFGKIPEFKFCACKVEPLKAHAAAE